MKNTFSLLRSRGVALKTSVVALSVVAASSANAAIPDWATGIGTQLGAAGTDMAAEVGPAVVIVLLASVAIKLFKRFGNKV